MNLPRARKSLKLRYAQKISCLIRCPSLLSTNISSFFVTMSTFTMGLGRNRFDDYILSISTDYKPIHAKPYLSHGAFESKARERI